MSTTANTGRSRWVGLLAALLIATLAGMGQPALAQSAPEPREGGVPSHAPPLVTPTGQPTTVTLVTGDRVTVGGAGAAENVTVDPGPRPDGYVPQFHITIHNGDVHVVPSDVRALVPHRLDRELFNVTALIDAGLDDAASDTIPVIITHGRGHARTLSELPAIQSHRSLSSVDATAAVFTKADNSISDMLVRAATATVSSAADDPLVAVDKIWLDTPVRAALDNSAEQIGAPKAWAAGIDGAGVTVAVLDTGIDAEHPDLADQIVAAANFSDSPGPADDRHGHGTHVAGTVAGTGAASDGDYRGVAPGVSLLNGKVLADDGFGHTSWVIEGMQWAAANGADIINLSLGSPVEDPLMVEAVERISADYDVLVVAATGNDGCAACVGSPAAAPRALAVGAVTGDDTLADFSNRGPTLDSRLVKPEVTAPGVGITAAAAGTDGPYAAMSGTSMAAPHAAGAAALLAQRYPHLSASELKGALMSTAVPGEGTVYEQGAGRVDVAGVLDAPLLATSDVLEWGMLEYPQDEPVTRPVTYHNVSDEAVTVALSVELFDDAGTPVSTAVDVAPQTVTVPPGDVGEAVVTIAPGPLGQGQFGGYVVAETADGDQLRTLLNIHNEPRYVELSFYATMRDGRAALRYAPEVFNVDTGEAFFDDCHGWEYVPGDPYCLRVPTGTYALMAHVPTVPQWHDGMPDLLRVPPLHTALVGEPELVVDRDLTVHLDAREAVEVTVDTPAHDSHRNLGAAAELAWYRQADNGVPYHSYTANGPGFQLEERLFMQPTASVTRGEFAAATRWYLEEPRITMSVVGHPGVDLTPYYYRSELFSTHPLLDGEHTLRLVDAGTADRSASDEDYRGAVALIRRSDQVAVATQVANVVEAGAELAVIYHDQPGPGADPGELHLPLAVPTVRLTHEEGLALRGLLGDGPVQVHAVGTPASDYLYDLVYTEYGQVPANLHYTADADDLVQVERVFGSQPDREPVYAETTFPMQPWADHSVSSWREVHGAPRTRTDYHAVDPGIQWSYALRLPADPMANMVMTFESPSYRYEQGERTHQHWLTQPLVAGLDPSAPVARAANDMRIPLAGVGDGANFGVVADAEITRSVRLWQGNELVYESEHGGAGAGPYYLPVRLPSEELPYRLEYQFDNAMAWTSLSARARTVWTFDSGYVDMSSGPYEILPLLHLEYGIATDASNTSLPPAERRGPPIIEIRAGYPPGAEGSAIDGIRLWVSFDDGQTWQERPARGGGRSDGYEFVVPDVRYGTGQVSLRVKAWDVAGNTIEQEIIGAYATG